MLACLSFAGTAAPASHASIEALLELARSEATVDSIHAQIEPVMTQSMRQAFAGKSLSVEQQRVIDTTAKQAIETLRTALSWASMKPEVVKTYQKTFLQEEIDGAIVFYQSPAGKATIDKLPLVTQRPNAFVVARMPAILAKLSAATQHALTQAKENK